MTDSEYYNCLSRDILKLLEDPRDYDMIITVGEDPDIKTYFVHSNILRVRSDYFKTALSSGWVKKENETIQFTKPNISPAVFDIILRFIYGGKVVFGKNQDPQLVFDCVIAADELAILELLKYAQNYLLENQINWLKENLALIYLRSFGIESLKELQEFSLDRIRKYPNLLFETGDFLSLTDDALELIIKDDELEMEELSIWEKLIQWGISKSQNLDDDITYWNVENFLTLGKIIQNCAKFIRFDKIDSSNFLEKVAPFKISLGTLYDEIGLKSSSKKSLPSRGSIVSTIMSYQHAAIIASWIDRKDINPDVEKSSNLPFYNPSQIPYKFRLLVRGSRDGFSPTVFHKLCDRVRSTVTLFKLANSDNFVGGYNPEVWDSPLWPNYKSSDKAFIFSFTQGGTNLNGQGNNNGKIGRVIDNVYALNCWRFNGPSFGKYDLVMHYGGFLRFKHQTFSPQVLPIDNALMRIEDYEVFEVIS